ncbi:MAG TPA: SPOR domain-containing protein [Caulobacteraceae bacterium]|nr:SPOR domain-containing protein [Caulobacteraceae bacterium]
MSDHDRGAYTPPSDRLSFDPREPVRSGGPAPVTLIVSGLVLLAIVGGVFLLYRGGVRHRGDAPAAVGTPIAQMKTAAPPDANDTGLVISRVDASNAANATFAPPPEQPLPRPLPVQAPSVVTATPLPPVGGAPSPAAPRPVATAPVRPAKPVTIASLTDDAMAPKPAALKPPPPPPTITPPPVATAGAAPAAGTGWVQIGAFSSAALAEKGWGDVAALAPAGMAGKGRKVEPVSKDGKTFYRTYVTGFAGRDAAQAFCDRLKAAGKACFVK